MSLSIYLIKNKDLPDPELVNLDKADPPIDLDIGEGAAQLYVKTEVVRQQPPWTRLFTALPEVPDGTFGRPNSVGAVLIYRAADATFLLSVEARSELTQGGCGQKLGLVMRRCPGADDAGRDCESPVSS
ncbi:MAG: DUF6119 family protein [Methylotenera sp.]|nr:DUF6119 family protein [Methylotenera sp.]